MCRRQGGDYYTGLSEQEFRRHYRQSVSVLNDESKTMSVRIKLQNRDYLLKPGMFTNVKVTCKASEERMARIDLIRWFLRMGRIMW